MKRMITTIIVGMFFLHCGQTFAKSEKQKEPTLTPVKGTPFEAEKTKYKVSDKPVDGNPFDPDAFLQAEAQANAKQKGQTLAPGFEPYTEPDVKPFSPVVAFFKESPGALLIVLYVAVLIVLLGVAALLFMLIKKLLLFCIRRVRSNPQMAVQNFWMLLITGAIALVLFQQNDAARSVAAIKSDVSSIEIQVSGVKRTVSSIDSDVSTRSFEGIGSKISSIESVVESIQRDVSSIESDVSAIKMKLIYQ